MVCPVPIRHLGAFAAVAALIAFASLAAPRAARAAAPTGFVDENAFGSLTFNLPDFIVFMPDGRKLVVEKEGMVWVVTPQGQKLTTPFIDLTLKVLSNDDRGLHGVALDPDFTTNGWVYFLYTVDPDSNGVDDNVPAFGRLERYKVSASDPNVIDLATRQILIGGGFADGWPEPPRNRHHMVGTLRFAADKTLIAGAGDGGDADITDAGGTDPSFGPGLIDPAQDIGAFRAQSLNSLDGKLLRVDKETGLGLPSNPYWNGNGAAPRSRTWIYGLRNPFRFSLRPGTGSSNPSLGQPGVIYIGDVGWNTTEELDIARTGGLNMAWPCLEGPYNNGPYEAVTQTAHPDPNVICSAPANSEDPTAATDPVIWWDHANGARSNPAGWVGNCSIGGCFVPGSTWPAAYQNHYYIADNGGGWIKSVTVDANDNVLATADFVTGGGSVCDVESDPLTGDLYYIDIAGGIVHRVRYANAVAPPVVVASVTPSSGFAPFQVVASASGSHDPNNDALTFQWNFGTGWTSTKADTTYTYANPGSFLATVIVRNAHGGVAAQSFPVTVGVQPPPGRILQPVTGTLFGQAQPIALAASALDSTAGTVTYRWDVDRSRNGAITPSVSTVFGRVGSVSATTPNDGSLTFLRIRLTATQGATVKTDTVFVYPNVNLAAGALAVSPASPGTLAPFTVTTMVYSTGEVGSPPSSLRLLEGTAVLGNAAIPAILQGDSALVAVQVGPLGIGDHALRVVLDPTASLVETTKLDNATTGSVTVSGLIAAFGFDEGAGTTTADASGLGQTGTLVGATWTTGHFGHALSFNGTSNDVDLGNSEILGSAGSMTWSAWVRPDVTPPDDGNIVARSDDNYGWQLKTTPDTGHRTFGIAVAGTGVPHTQRYSVTQPVLHTWYHVAAVYDADVPSLDLYVNGVLDDGVLRGAIPSAQYDPGLPTTIGKRQGGYFFGGLIDELRVYNRALSAAEIVHDMNTPLAGGQVGAPAPDAPTAFALGFAGPNPSPAGTALLYALPHAAHVRLAVYDVRGRQVATLVDADRGPGLWHAAFAPPAHASGLYFCRLEADGFTATRKLVVVR